MPRWSSSSSCWNCTLLYSYVQEQAGHGSASQPGRQAQVVEPHFEELCRQWAFGQDNEVFGELPATVTAGSVNDADARTQLQVDVVVLAPEDSGQPKRVLSLGEAKWDQTMTLGHLARLQRARDLLAVKGFDVTQARLACYSGAGFDDNLREAAQSDPRILLVGVADLYADSR